MAVAGRRQALQRCQTLVSLLSLSPSHLLSFIAWVIDSYYLNCYCLFLLPRHCHDNTFFCSFDLYSLSTPRSGAVRSRARFSPLSTGRLSIITRLIHDYDKRSSYYLVIFFNTEVNKLHTLGFEERESSAGSISRGARLERTETRIYTYTPP